MHELSGLCTTHRVVVMFREVPSWCLHESNSEWRLVPEDHVVADHDQREVAVGGDFNTESRAVASGSGAPLIGLGGAGLEPEPSARAAITLALPLRVAAWLGGD